MSHSSKRLNSSCVLCRLLNSPFAIFSCLDREPYVLNYTGASRIHTLTLLIYTALIRIIQMIMMRK